jgi:hypothetical protein
MGVPLAQQLLLYTVCTFTRGDARLEIRHEGIGSRIRRVARIVYRSSRSGRCGPFVGQGSSRATVYKFRFGSRARRGTELCSIPAGCRQSFLSNLIAEMARWKRELHYTVRLYLYTHLYIAFIARVQHVDDSSGFLGSRFLSKKSSPSSSSSSISSSSEVSQHFLCGFAFCGGFA